MVKFLGPVIPALFFVIGIAGAQTAPKPSIVVIPGKVSVNIGPSLYCAMIPASPNHYQIYCFETDKTLWDDLVYNGMIEVPPKVQTQGLSYGLTSAGSPASFQATWAITRFTNETRWQVTIQEVVTYGTIDAAGNFVQTK